jgi:hypothetical protein
VDRGTVLALSADGLKLAVCIDGDHCATFELASPGEVALGHRLRGNLESEFCFALENLSTAEMLDVTPLGRHVTLEEARRAIGA